MVQSWSNHNKNSNGNEQQVMTLTIDRNVSINDGNLIVTSGHGIDFSATANAQGGQYNSINPTTDSEILHDYEFGSFTPHIRNNMVLQMQLMHKKVVTIQK